MQYKYSLLRIRFLFQDVTYSVKRLHDFSKAVDFGSACAVVDAHVVHLVLRKIFERITQVLHVQRYFKCTQAAPTTELCNYA